MSLGNYFHHPDHAHTHGYLTPDRYDLVIRKSYELLLLHHLRWALGE